MGIAARNGMHGKIRVVMEIAEQRDGEAVQPLGPTGQKEILADDARSVRLQ